MFRDTIKDNIINTYLYIRNTIINNIFGFKYWRDEKENGYKLYSRDNFLKGNNKNWYHGQYYGNINPTYYWQFYTKECVYDGKYGLVLQNRYKEREFEFWDGNTYNTKWDVGIVTLKKNVTFGIYDFRVRLPQGKHLWPSIWLCGVDNYPPEIDLFEGATDDKGRYNSDFKTNIHYGESHKITGSKSMLRLKDSFIKDNDVTFRLLWEKDRIVFYMNGFKVRVMTDKKKLREINNEDMYLIVNNCISYDFKDVDKSQVSNLTLKEFRYFKK